MSLFLITVVLISIANGQGRYAPDKITNLPGLDFKTNYDQYSGYLNISNGRHLHYWLTESQSDPDNDPLVVWMNGGIIYIYIYYSNIYFYIIIQVQDVHH